MKEEPKPNIVYIDRDRNPPSRLINGGETISLPKDQSKPFYHERADLIISGFPELYKRFKEKGT